MKFIVGAYDAYSTFILYNMKTLIIT